MIQVYDDVYFMKQALAEAQHAYEKDEVPVGAVISCGNRIIARSHNTTEQLQDVTAHAEILCITAASDFLSSKYLKGCTLYVTLEPCVMCSGALFWSQIDRIVYGADDEKRGFMRYGKQLLHPETKVECGVMEEECRTLIQHFFKTKRKEVHR